MGEVTQFDPNALKKRVAETVQSTFGMLIPEDKWNSMVEQEVVAFFETEENLVWQRREEHTNDPWCKKYYHELIYSMTPFRLMVWQALKEQITERFKKVIDDDKFRSYVTFSQDGEETEITAWMEKKLEEIAPKMAAAMFKNVFAAAVDQAKNEIKQEMTNRL